jgi:hypothetical protein
MTKKTVSIRGDEKVFIDPKTKARTMAAPFRFKDGTAGIVLISRLKDEEWTPDEIISSITIDFI